MTDANDGPEPQRYETSTAGPVETRGVFAEAAAGALSSPTAAAEILAACWNDNCSAAANLETIAWWLKRARPSP